jgi:hypothetical protein
MSITQAQLAEWRRIIREEGALHSALAQRIAPRLLDEIERVWAELDRARCKGAVPAAGAAIVKKAAAPERRLAEVPRPSQASTSGTPRKRGAS